MPRLDDDHTGTRIKEQRKLARLTQRSWPTCSRTPTASSTRSNAAPGRPRRLRGGSRPALRVDVTVLTGQPYVTELQQDRLAALVRPIREALDLYDLGSTTPITVRPAEQLVGRGR